jgi:hypothetical protein
MGTEQKGKGQTKRTYYLWVCEMCGEAQQTDSPPKSHLTVVVEETDTSKVVCKPRICEKCWKKQTGIRYWVRSI